MKRILAPFAVALSFATIAIAGPSAAAEDDRNVVDGAKRLQIEFSGRITQRCSMGDIPDANLGVMGDTGFRIRANMALDCNVPSPFLSSPRTAASPMTRCRTGRAPTPVA